MKKPWQLGLLAAGAFALVLTAVLGGGLTKQAGAAGLLANSTFDTDITGWTADAGITPAWDATGNPGGSYAILAPASLQKSLVSDCVPSLAAGTYDMSADFKGNVTNGLGSVNIMVTVFVTANCTPGGDTNWSGPTIINNVASYLPATSNGMLVAAGGSIQVSLQYNAGVGTHAGNWDNATLVNAIPATDTPTPSVTNTPTSTAVPSTNTPTSTAVPPTNTATSTAVPPTNTATSTVVPPTNTATSTVVPPTNTPTSTAVPPTNTPTSTAVPPTNTATSTAIPATNTATSTAIPPTNTATSTAIPGTSTATSTAAPATNTPIATNTALAATNTPRPTSTSVPNRTMTSTAVVPAPSTTPAASAPAAVIEVPIDPNSDDVGGRGVSPGAAALPDSGTGDSGGNGHAPLASALAALAIAWAVAALGLGINARRRDMKHRE